MRSIFIYILILITPILTQAQISVNNIDDWLENSAFQSGEYLKYAVSYGIIKGGEAELKVDVVDQGGDWYYHFIAQAHTAGVAAKLFTIRDIYQSYVSIENGLPVKAIRNINEQAFNSYNEQLFRRSDDTLFSLKSGAHKMPPMTMDVLSAFYFARRYLFRTTLKKGDIIELPIFFDEKFYSINIKYYKKQKIKTRFGRIEVLKFRPVVDGKLFTDENEMEIWFTADENFIPVKIRVELPISRINCSLIEYSNLKNKTPKLSLK